MADADVRRLLEERISESAAATLTLLDEPRLGALTRCAAEITACLRGGGKVLLFGNGGSAADAQHLAAELVGRFVIDRPALPALALATNGSVVTAVGNDMAFAEVFARQVQALGQPGDVAVGLSTSGRSENVVRGLAAARERGLVTLAFTGAGGGPVGELADACVAVASETTARVQEAHILAGHVLCELVERELFGAGAPGAAPGTPAPGPGA